MIENKRVIAVVPARGGSKAVKDKNIHPLGGKPLIAWPIDVASDCPEIDRIIVSTDTQKITDVALRCGAEVYPRPSRLAGDEALVIDTLRDLTKRLRDEGETAVYMLLLEATSPMRKVEDVQKCLRLLDTDKLDSIATFTEASLPPAKAWRINDFVPSPYLEGGEPWSPRQKTEAAWELNGAVYCFVMDNLPSTGSALLFGKVGAVLMPKERSLDINEEIDFLIAETILEKTNANQSS